MSGWFISPTAQADSQWLLSGDIPAVSLLCIRAAQYPGRAGYQRAVLPTLIGLLYKDRLSDVI